MKKKITVIILALAILMVFASCGSKEPAEFGWGTYEKGTYENEFFEFSIDIPESYVYLTPQEIADKNPVIDEDGNPNPVDISQIEDLSAEAMVHYVYAEKYETETENTTNPHISIFAINSSAFDEIYDKEVYVENSLGYTAMIYDSSDVETKIYPLEKLWIDDRQFAKGILGINLDQADMFLEIFAVTKNNYILVINIFYSTEAEKQELHSLLDTIKIK